MAWKRNPEYKWHYKNDSPNSNEGYQKAEFQLGTIEFFETKLRISGMDSYGKDTQTSLPLEFITHVAVKKPGFTSMGVLIVQASESGDQPKIFFSKGQYQGAMWAQKSILALAEE